MFLTFAKIKNLRDSEKGISLRKRILFIQMPNINHNKIKENYSELLAAGCKAFALRNEVRLTQEGIEPFGEKGRAKKCEAKRREEIQGSKQARKSVKTKKRKNFENGKQSKQKCEAKKKEEGGSTQESKKTAEFRKLNRSWWKENARKRRRVASKTVPGFRGEAKKKAEGWLRSNDV